MNNDEINALLAKADAHPFYFGGNEESYFWRVALFEDVERELFVERVYGSIDGQVVRNYYYVYGGDKNATKALYESFVIDFVMYYYNDWRSGLADDVFEIVAEPNDSGLSDILRVFGKKYEQFLCDVLYWYGIAVETSPNSEGVLGLINDRQMTDDERLVKLVIKRLSSEDPITFSYGNTFYSWMLVEANNEIWYHRASYFCRGNYDYNVDEYGHCSVADKDAIEALRDAIQSCSYIDGWGILETDSNPNDQLKLVDLAFEKF